MLSKFFREIDPFNHQIYRFRDLDLLGKSIEFPKEEDPNFTYLKEEVDKENSVTTKESWQSSDGLVKFSRIVTTPKKKEVTREDLEKKLKAAVEAEDYELAAKLKKEIQKKKGE